MWNLQSVPGLLETMGLPFTYNASAVGTEANNSEMRFKMPPRDSLWLKFRLYIPQNFEHRMDIHLTMNNPQNLGWSLGDKVRAADGLSTGIIHAFDDTGVWIKYPNKEIYKDGVWVGQIVNVTRGNSLASTQHALFHHNNKLLAIWADGYSWKGLGPTIVWEYWSGEAGANNTFQESVLAVHYSPGNYVVANEHVQHTNFISPSDRGHYIDVMAHVQFSSGQGTNDGVIQTWLKKEGQHNFVKIHELSHANLDKKIRGANSESSYVGSPTDLQPWQNGYFMGASNSGFDQQTTFYLTSLEYFDALPAEL